MKCGIYEKIDKQFEYFMLVNKKVLDNMKSHDIIDITKKEKQMHLLGMVKEPYNVRYIGKIEKHYIDTGMKVNAYVFLDEDFEQVYYIEKEK